MNAPQYVVTNGTWYMTKCSGRSLGRIEQAYHWKTRQAAETQAAQMKKSCLDSSWRVEEVASDEPIQVFDTEDRAIKTSPEFIEMTHAVYDCVHSIGKIREMIDQCSRGLSQQDKIQEDLLHKIEFESMGRGQGAHLCTLLRDCRKKRRGYKDMLVMLQGISMATVGTLSAESLDHIQSKMDNRLYTPRSNDVF